MNRQEQAIELYKSGKSTAEIAQTLGVTTRTVQRDLLNVAPPENVADNTNVATNVIPNVAPKFKRYKKPGQKYLTKQNIEDMVTANEAKIKARKEQGVTFNVLHIEQAFKAGRQ